MADTSKLTQAVADLNTKVDTLIAKPAPAPSDQAEIDTITDSVVAITAKIPA